MSDGSLDHFHRHGYAVLRGLIDPAVVEDLRAFLADAVRNDCAPDLAAMGVDVTASDTGEAVGRALAAPLSPRQKHLLAGHFPLDVRLSERLWAVPRQVRVREIMAACLASRRLFMHMPPAARFVLPGNGHAGVPPHQDTSYNPHMRRFAVLWVPLVPIDEACAGMSVYEGGDRRRAMLSQAERDLWLPAVDVTGLTEVECIPMAVGDAIVLDEFVVHRSLPNISDRIRLSIDYRFFPPQPEREKHALDLDQWTVLPPLA